MSGKVEKKIRKEIRSNLQKAEYEELRAKDAEVKKQTRKKNAFKKILIILFVLNGLLLLSNVLIYAILLTK